MSICIYLEIFIQIVFRRATILLNRFPSLFSSGFLRQHQSDGFGPDGMTKVWLPRVSRWSYDAAHLATRAWVGRRGELFWACKVLLWLYFASDILRVVVRFTESGNYANCVLVSDVSHKRSHPPINTTDFRMDEATQAGDPCHSYTWSILFCVVMVLALLAWMVALALVCPHLHHHLRRQSST